MLLEFLKEAVSVSATSRASPTLPTWRDWRSDSAKQQTSTTRPAVRNRPLRYPHPPLPWVLMTRQRAQRKRSNGKDLRKGCMKWRWSKVVVLCSKLDKFCCGFALEVLSIYFSKFMSAMTLKPDIFLLTYLICSTYYRDSIYTWNIHWEPFVRLCHTGCTRCIFCG